MPPYPCDYKYAGKSMEMTHRWLDRCMARMAETAAPLWARADVVSHCQGSTYPELRKASAHAIAERGAAGNAIGGCPLESRMKRCTPVWPCAPRFCQRTSRAT